MFALSRTSFLTSSAFSTPFLEVTNLTIHYTAEVASAYLEVWRFSMLLLSPPSCERASSSAHAWTVDSMAGSGLSSGKTSGQTVMISFLLLFLSSTLFLASSSHLDLLSFWWTWTSTGHPWSGTTFSYLFLPCWTPPTSRSCCWGRLAPPSGIHPKASRMVFGEYLLTH